MNDLVLKTKLGKRLRFLLNCIPSDTDEVWDLCCDHGAIGRAVLESRPSCEVIFNDIHQDIMARLEETLVNLNASNYRLDVGPAQSIKLPSNNSLTIVLAGVGSEQCIEILQELLSQPAALTAYFIISPATKTYYVREFLCKAGVYLELDEAVSENKRTYEVLGIRLSDIGNHSKRMTRSEENLFGNGWTANNPDHQKHIRKLLNYYQSAQNPDAKTKAICKGYTALLEKLKTQP